MEREREAGAGAQRQSRGGGGDAAAEGAGPKGAGPRAPPAARRSPLGIGRAERTGAGLGSMPAPGAASPQSAARSQQAAASIQCPTAGNQQPASSLQPPASSVRCQHPHEPGRRRPRARDRSPASPPPGPAGEAGGLVAATAAARPSARVPGSQRRRPAESAGRPLRRRWPRVAPVRPPPTLFRGQTRGCWGCWGCWGCTSTVASDPFVSIACPLQRMPWPRSRPRGTTPPNQRRPKMLKCCNAEM